MSLCNYVQSVFVILLVSIIMDSIHHYATSSLLQTELVRLCISERNTLSPAEI
jgi:hypothetical protein